MTYEILKQFTPTSKDGFYARNNQFQFSGPKGFYELKPLENGDLYVRVDLPGLRLEDVRHCIDPTRKVVFFGGKAPKRHALETPRTYLGLTGLACDCCFISGIEADFVDGVLRMILKKTSKSTHAQTSDAAKQTNNTCSGGYLSPIAGGSGRVIEKHPFVVEGNGESCESKLISEDGSGGGGGLHVRLDVPGVGRDGVSVFFKDGAVRFLAVGQKGHRHDDGGREYMGEFCSPRIPKTILHGLHDGVLRLTISL